MNIKKSLIFFALSYLFIFVVQDVACMGQAPEKRHIQFFMKPNYMNAAYNHITIMVYSYNPDLGAVAAGGVELDAGQGSMRLRGIDLYKGSLVACNPPRQFNKKFWRMSRSSKASSPKLGPEGYIQKIEIEDPSGKIYKISQQTVDLFNRIFDKYPDKVLTIQIIRNEDPFANGNSYYMTKIIDEEDARV